MKTVLTLTVAAAFATSAFAQDVTPAPERDANGVYQVIRATDGQLSCAQLIAEMNLLNAQIKNQAAQQAAAAPKAPSQAGNVARGLFGAAAQQGLARFGGGGFGVGRAAAAQAASGVVANMSAPQQAAAPTAPAAVTDEQQRLNRIAPIFAAKSC